MAINALPRELQEYVDQEVARGNFPSGEELLRDAVRLHRDRKLYELRKQVEAGLVDVEQGAVVECSDDASLPEFFEQVKSRGREQLAGRHDGT